MKKIFALCLASVMLMGTLAGCSSSSDSSSTTTEAATTTTTAAATTEETLLVGVAMPTKDLQRWVQDGENMQAELEAAGYTVDLQYAANDIPTQVSQIQNMIANGAGALVIASIDGSALGTVMAEAEEAGIPVIAYDRLIMDSAAVTYYATFDNWDVGVKQGEYLVEALGLATATEPVNMEFITGDPGDNNINFFFDGAISVLQEYIDSGIIQTPSGQTEKTAVATANWATDEAQSRFETILSSYYSDGTQLDAVLASNDSTALGVANALAANYTGTYPIITGQDCDIANVPNLVSGLQAMSVFKDTRDLAAATVDMVTAIMEGSEPPVNDTATYDNGTGIIPSYLCEPIACDLNNIEEVLIDSGYYTADQVGLN
ncbi:sugar ABC transporter substrate-binding protein [Bengtsoniella intestinalis]|uniref:substrate-binding domain-containing protein n=1 Tax=Bengtsoniella intestinalis TaxID=3073143 RepID=UPI00391EF54E